MRQRCHHIPPFLPPHKSQGDEGKRWKKAVLGQMGLGLALLPGVVCGALVPVALVFDSFTSCKHKFESKAFCSSLCKSWEKVNIAPTALQAGNETRTLSCFHFLFSCELLTSSYTFCLCVAAIDNLGSFVLVWVRFSWFGCSCSILTFLKCVCT